MKVLVTGGNGFLGSWIVKELALHHEVRVLHRASSDMAALQGISFQSTLGDVTDFESLRKACEGIDAVFHVAGVISYSRSEYEVMKKVNIGGTANIVRAAKEAGVKRLVHTSSTVAVGATPFAKVLNEESPYELVSYDFGYYETKRRAEDVVREAVKNHGLHAVIVNPSIMFGAGDAVKGSRKVHMLVARGRFPFYTHGGVNVIHVADAVDGHIKALERGRPGERYILGGENILVKELFEILARAGHHHSPPVALPTNLLRSLYKASRKIPMVKIPAPSDQTFLSTMYHWYDNAKASQELGLSPRPAIQAVEESVNWALKNT